MSGPRATTTYTCIGPVRGRCDVQHRTLATAWRCCAKDQRACASLGGGSYSDRSVRPVRDGALDPQWTEDEMNELDYLGSTS
jgi:hypothetical protein